MKSFAFLSCLIATNLRSSVALRTSFLLQLLFMAINNLIFFSIWWIFFESFKEINGWKLPELEAMFAFSAGSFGLTMIFAGGIRNLAKKIIDGEIDAYLVQPKNVLLQIVGSQSMASGWGDVLSSVVLLQLSGYLTRSNLPIIILLHITASLVYLGAGIIAHSLAFWLGPMDTLARQLFEFVITFSVYPQTIFPGLFRIFLFTVIPAGFIGFLPIEILREYRWDLFILAVGGSLLYLCIAVGIFFRGLRRYESGNRISI